MLALEKRRITLGVSMDRLSAMAGTADRLYAKNLYAETASGRRAGWEVLQRYFESLYPDGFEIQVVPTEGRQCGSELMRAEIAEARRTSLRTVSRELMVDELRRRGLSVSIKKAPKRKPSSLPAQYEALSL